MEQLKKLATYLGYNIVVINDTVHIKTVSNGYVRFEPLDKHALEIEEVFNLSTEYCEDTYWTVTGKECSYSAATAAKARLSAALSYLEDTDE